MTPDLKRKRDELAAEYYGSGCGPDGYAKYRTPEWLSRTTFAVGFAAALSELAKLAGESFDPKAADEEYYTRGHNDPAWSERSGFIEGARWQHQRDFARIQELEAALLRRTPGSRLFRRFEELETLVKEALGSGDLQGKVHWQTWCAKAKAALGDE